MVDYRDVIGPVETLQSCLLTCLCLDPAFLFPLFASGPPIDVTVVHDCKDHRKDLKKDVVFPPTKSQTMPNTPFKLPDGHEWTWISHFYAMGASLDLPPPTPSRPAHTRLYDTLVVDGTKPEDGLWYCSKRPSISRCTPLSHGRHPRMREVHALSSLHTN